MNLSAQSINDAATIAVITEDLRQAGDAAAGCPSRSPSTRHWLRPLSPSGSPTICAGGCRLALDDFGTGFGSFTELRGMTLHKLKIDQSFVSGLLRNPRTKRWSER